MTVLEVAAVGVMMVVVVEIQIVVEMVEVAEGGEPKMMMIQMHFRKWCHRSLIVQPRVARLRCRERGTLPGEQRKRRCERRTHR